jgi:hypothetical protein
MNLEVTIVSTVGFSLVPKPVSQLQVYASTSDSLTLLWTPTGNRAGVTGYLLNLNNAENSCLQSVSIVCTKHVGVFFMLYFVVLFSNLLAHNCCRSAYETDFIYISLAANSYMPHFVT